MMEHTPNTIPKEEYCVIALLAPSFKDSVNKNSKLLNNKAEEGWVLVSITDRVAYFKRELISPDKGPIPNPVTNPYVDPKTWVKSMADVYKAAGLKQPDITPDIEIREKLIMQVFNKQEDGTTWKPNFSNPNQNKWIILVKFMLDNSVPRGFRLSFNGTGYDNDYSYLGCRLHLKDQETADHIGKYLLPELQDGITPIRY